MSVDDDLFAEAPAAQLVDHQAAEVEDSEADSESATNRYADVFEFVEDHLVQIYARPTEKAGAMRWCPKWHHHAEAFARLTALWKAFEALRTDPGAGTSTWWLEHADPMMTALTAPDGTFRDCGPDEHRSPPALPTVTASEAR